MIEQKHHEAKKVATNDPFLMLTELLIKIDRREKVVEKLEKEDEGNEGNQRDRDNASKSQ